MSRAAASRDAVTTTARNTVACGAVKALATTPPAVAFRTPRRARVATPPSGLRSGARSGVQVRVRDDAARAGADDVGEVDPEVPRPACAGAAPRGVRAVPRGPERGQVAPCGGGRRRDRRPGPVGRGASVEHAAGPTGAGRRPRAVAHEHGLPLRLGLGRRGQRGRPGVGDRRGLRPTSSMLTRGGAAPPSESPCRQVPLGHASGVRRGQLDWRLRGLHLAQRLVDPDDVADLDYPGEHFALGRGPSPRSGRRRVLRATVTPSPSRASGRRRRVRGRGRAGTRSRRDGG